MNTFLPSEKKDRIASLDVLRGVAVLGILLMNIQSFSMIGAAYINPTAFGDLTGVNKAVWILTHVFSDQKFLGIFSMLFGAGIVLFTDRAVVREKPFVALHYKRMFYLLLFGLAHAYLLWHGDILVTYSICGLWVFLLRKKSVPTLLISGIIIFAVPSFIYLFMGFSLDQMPKESYAEMMQSWLPDPVTVDAEVAAFKGGWIKQMSHRVPHTVAFQTMFFLMFMGWKVTGFMLIGMALYKIGVLSNLKSRKYYTVLAITGLLAGLTLSGFGVHKNFQNGWSLDYSMFFGCLFNYWGSFFTSLGYIGLIMLLSKHAFMSVLFQPVGKMAFTNYLLQSLICTLLFYGHGFGVFGSVERSGQLLIVLAVWVLLILLSGLWLKYFEFGPMEWLWRSLTYQKIRLGRSSSLR
ncbi:MAG: DUF418 domain-containing protein [Cytophagales bacterium]|nr:DUF418 domain-containing protein [Cytophagales bacterium]